MANDKLAKPQTFGILSAAPDELAAMQELVAEAVRDDVTQFDLPEVKVPAGGGTSWDVPTLEGDQAVKSLRCVILCAQRVRQYYADEFSGENNPPDCASADGCTGQGCPGGDCASCPLAQWGSGTNGGQACSERRHMMLLKEDAALPMFLNLPPSSLKGFKKFRALLLGAMTPLHGVVVELGLTKAKSSTGIEDSQVTFTAAGKLDPEATAHAAELRDVFAAMLTARMDAPAAPDPAAAVNVDDFIDAETTPAE